MKMKHISSIKKGDVLEQNIFRHDSLLALPKGTRIKDKEKEYLKDLQLQYAYISPFDKNRQYDESETIGIIKDTIFSCTLWEQSVSKKLFEVLQSKLKRNKKILELFSKLRQIDHYSFVSSVNITMVVAKTMIVKNKADKHLGSLAFHALIHDIGKIRVSKITNKEAELTDTEFAMVRKHPVFSYKLLEHFGFSRSDILYALQTHERYDGSGYPMRLQGEQIEPLAQIIAIAEMYNALSSFRPHRPSFHPIEVRNKVEEERDRAFGNEYVEIFLKKFTPYRTGAKIEMSNGMEGKIIEINDKAPLFPKVELYNPDTGEIFQTLNLFQHKDLRIARVLV